MTKDPVSRLMPAWISLPIVGGNVLFVVAAAVLGYIQMRQYGDAIEYHDDKITANAEAIGEHDRVLSQHEDAIWRFRNIEIVTVEITAHMPLTHFDSWDEHGLYQYPAPQVPADAQTHALGDIISCSEEYKPMKAWHEIIGSWPDSSIMYSVNANVTDDGEIEIALRTRQGYSRGYAYVEVLVLCRSEPGS